MILSKKGPNATIQFQVLMLEIIYIQTTTNTVAMTILVHESYVHLNKEIQFDLKFLTFNMKSNFFF